MSTAVRVKPEQIPLSAAELAQIDAYWRAADPLIPRRNLSEEAEPPLSITWANTSLPAYISVSRIPPGSLPFYVDTVQVVNTWKSHEPSENAGLQRFNP